MTTPSHSRAITLAIVGTVLEWAEYTFYGYMALQLANHFFPAQNASLAVLKTFAIFALGYIIRPLGAILFGHIGDVRGRKPALMWSLIIMGLATLAIGFLPTYERIGVLAPIGLLICRLIQGFAVSGEYNGAGIFLLETAGSKNPCFMSSLIPASAAFGMVLGGVAAFLVSLPQAPIWAWRLPFLLGALGCFMGVYLRRTASETQVFSQAKASKTLYQIPFFALWDQNKRSMIFTAAVGAFTGIYVYIGNVYFIVFLKQQAGLPTHTATLFAIIGESLVALLIPVMGYVADNTNPLKQYRQGLLSIVCFAPLIFYLSKNGNYFGILIGVGLYGITQATICAPMVKLLYDVFPPSLRYTGTSFAWNMSVAIFAGTAPMVANLLVDDFSWIYGPGFYVSLTAICTLLLTRLGKEKANLYPCNIKLVRSSE